MLIQRCRWGSLAWDPAEFGTIFGEIFGKLGVVFLRTLVYVAVAEQYKAS